jgi:hypothetical protein
MPSFMARLLGANPSACAPVFQIKLMSLATRVPSFMTPVLSFTVAGVEPADAVNSSVLVMTIFTGLPLFIASAIVIGSRRGSILPPNPPPTFVQITRILLSGTPKRPAMTVRNSNTSWEQVQTVIVPPRSATRAACGSM